MIATTTALHRQLAADEGLLQWQLDRIFSQLSMAAQQVVSATEAHVECEEEGVMLLFAEGALPPIIRRQLARREILDAIYRGTGIRVVMVSTEGNVYRFSRRYSGWWNIELLHEGES